MKAVNKAWKEAFHPEYAETLEYRAVTSHFGRHYFTTFWRKDQRVSDELVQYVRGDKIGDPANDKSGMHHYLHAYYEDIDDLYRQNVYTLDIAK